MWVCTVSNGRLWTVTGAGGSKGDLRTWKKGLWRRITLRTKRKEWCWQRARRRGKQTGKLRPRRKVKLRAQRAWARDEVLEKKCELWWQQLDKRTQLGVSNDIGLDFVKRGWVQDAFPSI